MPRKIIALTNLIRLIITTSVAAIAGCYSTLHPFDGTSGFQIAELQPDAMVVSLIGNSGESWKTLDMKLKKLCLSTYPDINTVTAVKILDQQEVDEPTEISIPAASTGSTDLQRYPIPSEPPVTVVYKTRKILALCQNGSSS